MGCVFDGDDQVSTGQQVQKWTTRHRESLKVNQSKRKR
jgi:hypothetical protein